MPVIVGYSNQLIKCAFGETAIQMGRWGQDEGVLCPPVHSVFLNKVFSWFSVWIKGHSSDFNNKAC